MKVVYHDHDGYVITVDEAFFGVGYNCYVLTNNKIEQNMQTFHKLNPDNSYFKYLNSAIEYINKYKKLGYLPKYE